MGTITSTCMAPDRAVGQKERFFNQEALEFINTSKEIARSILNNGSAENSTPSSRKVVEVHHHYHSTDYWNSPFWSRPVYVVNASSSRHDDNDRALRAFVGVIFSFVAGAAFYAMGATLKNFNESSETLNNINSFKSKVRSYRNISQESEKGNFDKLNAIAKLSARITQRKINDTLWNLAMSVAFAVAGTMAVIGALTTSYACMTAGTVIALVGAATMLFRWGFDSTQQRQASDAKRILALAE